MGYDVENTAGNARGCHPDREQSQPTFSYEHNEIFYKGFRGKAKSRKPGQPCQPGSKEEGL